MSTININDIELELNLLDADVLDKYTKLNAEIVEKINEPTQYEGISVADGLRKQCRYVDQFFDALFGEGTAKKIFGINGNLAIRMDAFAQVSAMSKNARSELATIANKYGVGRIENRNVHQHKHQKQKYNNRNRR